MADRQWNAAVTNLSSVDFGGRTFAFLALSGVTILATVLIPVPMLKPALFGAASGLFAVSMLAAGQGMSDRLRSLLRAPRLSRVLRVSTVPTVLTDRTGAYLCRNPAAHDLPELSPGESLTPMLDAQAAEPGAVIARLSAQAIASGSAASTLATGTRIWVTRQKGDRLAWTFTPQGTSGPRLPDTPADSSEAAHKDVPGPEGSPARPTRMDALAPTDPVLAQPDLLNALPVPMLKVSADGTLIAVNAQARAVLNIGPDRLPPLFELVEGMGRPISDWLTDAAEGRGLLKPEIVRAVIPGQELFLQITLGRTVEEDGVVLVGILNDATELKTLEAQFVQSQKMQAIGQLAGGVAHDFNNLLTAISGHCDLLLLRHDSGDPDFADLIQISQNANRAASLVGQLLAFSRKQNLKPQALDLRDTMSDLAHLLNRLIGERITLDVSHAPGPKAIRADRRQLEQVIVNLVVNARDAMPDGGTISVSTRNECLDREVIRDRAHLVAGDYVVIEVRDTGVGISPDGLSKIFEPFYTTKKTGEGTGLGLSTAYGIVKQTGGYIFVESTPDEGTVFSLYFPANAHKDALVQPKAEKPAHAPVVGGDGVILLVEDEAPVRAFAGRALRLRGYTVVEAENAEQALDILEDDSLAIDVFVTDVIMPGMDGPTWVRQALRQRPDTRVVFMSGYAEEGRAEKQARIPNSVFLPKPFSLQQLTSLVQDQMH